MTEQQLLQDVSGELTLDCSLPIQLPFDRIKTIVKNARDFFYDNYQYAVEERYMALNLELFSHPEFAKTRTLKLPDCIQSVYDLREMGGIGIFGVNSGDFADSKMIGATLSFSPFALDNLMYSTVMYSFYDLSKAYTLESIAFSFNKNSKKLMLKGRNPRKNTFIKCYVKLSEEDLYEDELFRRYCKAMAKINLARLLGTFQYNLPGGVQLNYNDIKADGKEELADIKAQMDSENSPDWLMQWNG
jgi:hypothetical protein